MFPTVKGRFYLLIVNQKESEMFIRNEDNHHK